MPYRLATPQQSPFSVIYFPVAVKTFYAASKILIVFSAKSAMVSDISFAPVAQLDRVSASEAEGRGFESRRAHQFKKNPRKRIFLLGRRGADKNSRAAVLGRIGIRAALYSSSRSPLGLWRSICRVPTANAESMDCVVASLRAMTILVIPCKYWHSRRQIPELPRRDFAAPHKPEYCVGFSRFLFFQTFFNRLDCRGQLPECRDFGIGARAAVFLFALI